MLFLTLVRVNSLEGTDDDTGSAILVTVRVDVCAQTNLQEIKQGKKDGMSSRFLR